MPSQLSRVGSSIMGGLFPNQGASSYGGPTNWYTPYSSAVNGNVSLDPSIRGLQTDYLTAMKGIGSTYDTASTGYTSSINDIISRYLGNEGAYVKAATDPIMEQGSQAIGAATANLGLRGLGGSSFLSDTLTGAGIDLGRAVADAKAKAVATNLGFEQGSQGDILNAAGLRAGVAGTTAGALDTVSQQRLSQELSSLGLSQNQISQLMDAFQNQQARAMGLQGQQLAGIGGLLDILKTIRGGGGSAGVTPSIPAMPDLGAGTIYGGG